MLLGVKQRFDALTFRYPDGCRIEDGLCEINKLNPIFIAQPNKIVY
jgi:hypothetical protein